MKAKAQVSMKSRKVVPYLPLGKELFKSKGPYKSGRYPLWGGVGWGRGRTFIFVRSLEFIG